MNQIRVIGLRYKSSITGKPCIALDIPNRRCVDHDTDEPAFLKLHADTVKHCSI